MECDSRPSENEPLRHSPESEELTTVEQVRSSLATHEAFGSSTPEKNTVLTEECGMVSAESDENDQLACDKKEEESVSSDSFLLLHFKQNPLKIASDQLTESVEELKKENTVLKARLAEFERMRQEIRESETDPSTVSRRNAHRMDADITARVGLNLEMRCFEAENKRDFLELAEEVQRFRSQFAKVNEINAKVAKAYREVCALLTGYQCKMKNETIFTVQSIFENAEKEFVFRKAQDNRLELIENDYTKEWMDFIEAYLYQNNSIPAFLAAVNLHLFKRNLEIKHVH
ncbi:unnamed protein product [Soboliphyme baturini]|uniref:Uncharacterized protein n=1 Tax=Soboliphyme baturini TaxID=241478 RepID=A0A183I8X5_9BILA|nr:unnamed protein product [Soboliphyme baturini]